MNKQVAIQRKKDYSSQPYFTAINERKERLKRFVASLEDFFRDIDDTDDQEDI